MKSFGWDIKYGFYIVGALIASFPLFLYAPGILLLVVASLLILFGLNQRNSYRFLNSWKKVEGEILQSEIGKYKVSVGAYSRPYEYYFPLAYFSYTFNGVDYKSNKYCFDRKSVWSTNLDEIEPVTEKIRVGEKVSVFVNPRHPEMAVLNIKVAKQSWSHSSALIVSGVLLFIIAGLVWYHS